MHPGLLQGEKSSEMMVADGDPVLTVVVMGYRNEATILRSIRSVVDQSSDDPFEIVVVTSGGDHSADLVTQAFPHLSVVDSSSRLFPGGARNAGIRMARGRLVAFLAADCLAGPGWVRNRVALHRAGHDVVAGALSIGDHDPPAARACAYLLYPARLRSHKAGPAESNQMYGLSYTRDLLGRLGPFDETLLIAEDTDMAWRLKTLGVQPWFEPSVWIQHMAPRSLIAMLADQYKRGRRASRSWALLTIPPGPLRVAWEAKPRLHARAVVERSLRNTRWRCKTVWTSCAGNRRDLIRCGPWLVLGHVAYQLGWAVDQLTSAKPLGGAVGSAEP